ncbi:MAG: hypothetical protein ABSD44_10110 [Terracidiphilus sp.]
MEKVTAIIAVYGAVLSTVAVAKQLISERVSIKITALRDMMTHGDPRHDGTTLIILRVTNKGRRPVTITHTGARSLYPGESFMCGDNEPLLAHEIKEGECITSYMNQSDTDITTIDFWQAIDSTGRVYKLREASWLKHWKSVLQRGLAMKS